MNKEQLLEIINTYGVMKQLKYFQSEIFELNEAIINYEQENNKFVSSFKENIVEEIADVLVMLNQFKEYYEITDEEITKVMDYKIKKQIERIENER